MTMSKTWMNALAKFLFNKRSSSDSIFWFYALSCIRYINVYVYVLLNCNISNTGQRVDDDDYHDDNDDGYDEGEDDYFFH